MPRIKQRLEHLEAHLKRGGRPLTALLHIHPAEMTDLELMAVIQGCETWKVKKELIEEELMAIAGGEIRS